MLVLGAGVVGMNAARVALTNRTLPYIKILAENGIENSIRENTSLRSALNTYQGRIMHEALTESLGYL